MGRGELEHDTSFGGVVQREEEGPHVLHVVEDVGGQHHGCRAHRGRELRPAAPVDVDPAFGCRVGQPVAGFDADASVRVGDAAWVNVGVGFVDAELKTGEALPRIPPLRGRVSVDLPYRGVTVTPELLVAARQNQVFRGESDTSGYSVFNLKASYVLARSHVGHILSVRGYNLTNKLYRNHTSFIKDFAPEIGRGVTPGYSVRFF